MDSTAATRWCPECGARCDETRCPRDQTPTVALAEAASRVGVGGVIDGRYRVGAVLGRGGFGEVVEAVHVGTRQEVAIKVLHSRDADPVTVQRFLREARVTATLRSPHTVRVLDVGLVGDAGLYIAMERLRGRTLEDHLHDGYGHPRAIAEAEAVAIAIAVLRSVEEAHRNGLVHRDLKPANVFLCDDTRNDDGTPMVKVLDFGIAHSEGSSLTESAIVIGSPAWMSPEQCQSLPLDGRSDLYAVGAILYRCLAGRPPFVDASPLQLMYRHVHERPAPLEQAALVPISTGLAATVGRAMSKRPEERHPDAESMRVALEQLRARPRGVEPQMPLSSPWRSQPISATPATAVTAPLDAGRHATWIAAAIAAAVASVWLGLEFWGRV